MRNNKKGFTLIELIGVIVILIVILLIAVSTVNKLMEKSRLNAFVEESNQIIKAAENKFATDRVDHTVGALPDDAYRGSVPGKVCYTIETSLIGKYVDKTDNKYRGSVELCYGLDCTEPAKIWITNGEKYLTAQPQQDSVTNVADSTSEEFFYTCGTNSIGAGGTSGTTTTADFDFTESIQTFVVAKTGVYKLEAWGAAGGDDYSTGKTGGSGAYVSGEVKLQKGNILYVTVGGQGQPSTSNNCQNHNNGFNNGGYYCVDGQSATYTGSGGGGSTHFLSKDGLLKDVTNNDIYIVAAGGNGAPADNRGTLSDGNALDPEIHNKVGTAFGNNELGVGGGYSYRWNVYPFSYVNTNKVKNQQFYAGNRWTGATERFDYEHYVSTFSEEPTSQMPKSGNGYARITYIGTNFSS